MSLKSLSKRLPKLAARPDCEIDLTPAVGEAEEGEDNLLRFREPRAPDFFQDAKARKQLQIDFPEFNDLLASQVMMFAACYLPGKDEGGMRADVMFAQLARDNHPVFLYIVEKFGDAFPQTRDWEKGKADVGNG